ncbi:nucleoside-diphosphate sugar epimerase [Candidatus Uhrbacteria bacterium RIFCSPLOWO2_01_FULL_47_24]|uniref:UDP-glucuronate decarboxylase n=1 Tax=Candidatus Uhrbacteria bacterium RIFCSPLOWO2_01_FULL_47_24 TaxID=1802401 RepID=A0A1F7UTJ3_9BACT|nr:MAG: nucleoside-diphosphate sugar epimerase [Candidatus Uhrbacteria bacterium RIFCSPHIGHO2_02_FULL_46_47]OGL76800.1 MAG: nucleoside-diphosphate sugar epimerase [Candidatus Uhrbacteria bacterium RIFCSPHIGHO2_12_FULL_47_11]OGL81576.1 MAG: nucleoside-diphosphate sugar epimerase [Candidatus Uhrbacteria bacterium RIFCSPLOWO2_01_FULL_47_24]OGL83958.1 MAG: nucleoside-diphosphate sugar epimerase [Candidatus Uhrbacteria bacterium RIFCSPLOWO2_02_FULL_46_25]OGL91585.1 MAG: nucleoside-diphosphate sugar 
MANVLITGGAGFIGSHLSELLLQGGMRITVLDDLSTGRRDNIKKFQENNLFKFIEGSILDNELVNKLVQDADIIYHLAAALHVKLILEKPLSALETNIHGTENVLRAAKKRKVKTFIASTSEIYGKNTKQGLDEEDDRILGSPLKTRWGYASAKGIDELFAYLYFKEYGVPIVIARLFNTVGPRQTGQYGMVVPRFVSQALQGEDITVFGDGKQKRCFLHVQDALAAITMLMSNEQAVGKVFNIGNEEEISIEDLAKKIIMMTGSLSRIVYIPYEKAYPDGFEDMQRRFPSVDRLWKLTKWKPTMKIDQILESVIASARL